MNSSYSLVGMTLNSLFLQVQPNYFYSNLSSRSCTCENVPLISNLVFIIAPVHMKTFSNTWKTSFSDSDAVATVNLLFTDVRSVAKVSEKYKFHLFSKPCSEKELSGLQKLN